MPRKTKVEEVVEEAVEEVVEVKKATKDSYPEVAGNGKFQAVEVAGGWVVYNPAGQRTTEAVAKNVADDIVRANNIAGHFK